MYSDGNKKERGVGSEIAIFIKNKRTHQSKHHNRCSNDQPEQTELLKALHTLDSMKLSNNTLRLVKVFTDRKKTLSSLKTPKVGNT